MEDQALEKEREELIAKAAKKGIDQEAAEQMSTDQLRALYGRPAENNNPGTEKKAEPKALADMSLEDLEGMSDKALKKLCKAEDMVTDGVKGERFNRLYAKRFGLTSRYIGADTRCQFCAEKVRVRNTAKEQQADGRILVTRSMKCVGRHHHIYPLSQFEGKK